MLSIVIPTRDKAPRLRLCLRTLASALTGVRAPDSEVIVVDDGSGAATRDVLEEARQVLGDRLRMLRFEEPLGRAGARNSGAEAASGSRLLFLDDDILVGPEVLHGHMEAERASGSPVLARATILNLPWLRHLEDPAAPDQELPPRLAAKAMRVVGALDSLEQLRSEARRTAFEADLHRLLAYASNSGRWLAATGGNLSIDRNFFGELAGFDRRMGLRWGVEDLDLGLRAERRGGYIAHLHNVAVYHMDHLVANRDADHAINLGYFTAKHGDVGARLSAYFAGENEIEDVMG
jgi:GT2 family glycosyltransferase